MISENNRSKIFLFDSYSSEKKEFVPLVPGEVKMYTCGPTVYDYPHLGNMRAYVFADVLRRILEYNGLNVKQVMNITDVGHLVSDADEGEDKVELKAAETGKSAWEIAEFFTQVFKEDIAKLNIQPPSIFCKATDHIKEQIELIKKLEENGYTYRTSDGIYFDTAKFTKYGQMAKLKKEEIKPGARVELNPEKRNPTDFALWKFSPKDKKRQMECDSPWGIGFPGWHIECSAMSMRYLGPTLDIHTGGIDHIPIHHTNEIAQSEAATGQQFVRYWLHVNFLTVEGRKMSKSLGNIITLREIEQKDYDPLSLRYLFLTAHYRSVLNFTWQALASAQVTLNLLRSHLASWPDGGKVDPSLKSQFLQIINNDVDTPKALAFLWDLVRDRLAKMKPEDKKATILDFDRVFGLKLKDWLETSKEIPLEVKQLVLQREELRKEQKWAEADKIREKILTFGYYVEDTPSGPRLRKVK